MNNTTKWILKDGAIKTDCSSFPFAYRTMSNIIRKGVETGRKFDDMSKTITITGPIAPGAKAVTYSYATAKQKALDQGLIDIEGQINAKEFKKR